LNKITPSQTTAWLLTATVAPILCIAGKTDWLPTLVSALVCGVITIACLRLEWEYAPHWLCVVELIWLVVMLAGIAQQSSTCWAVTGDEWQIAAVLLLLAGFSAQKGASPAARVGATLIWLILPVLGIVLAAGTTQINLEWVDNQFQMPHGLLISLLLIPALGIFLPRHTRKGGWAILALGIIAVVGAVIMDGVMGKQVSANTANAIYEFSKGVNLFGVAERFEALVACALTSGWFALLSMLLSVAYHLTERMVPHRGQWGIWICIALSLLLLCNLHISAVLMGLGSLIFWGFLPVLTQGIVKLKKVEKS